MKLKFRRPSPAMVVACLALFVASPGTSIAASHYLITSTKQIKPSVIKALKGAKGPAGQSVTGLTGPQGPKGDTGATGAAGAKGDTGAAGAAGAAGAQGRSGVVTTAAFNGGTTVVPGSVSAYVFVGYTATVTTTASQRLTGAAEVPLYSTASTGGQLFDYGLCYQPSTGGTISNFAGGSSPSSGQYSTAAVYPEKRSFAASASVVPGAGTWKVGFCVMNENANPMTSDWVDGWVQVTN